MDAYLYSKQYGQIKATYLETKHYHSGQSRHYYLIGAVTVRQSFMADRFRKVDLIVSCPVKHPKKMQQPDKKTMRRADSFLGAMLSDKKLYSPTCVGDVLFKLR